MEFLKKNKIITAVTVVALLVLLYFVFFSAPSTPALTATAVGPDPASQNLLATLSNLHTIRLDGGIFSNPVFVSLSDFGVVLPSPPAPGRRDPFLPTAKTAVSTSTTKIKAPALAH